MVEDIYKKYPDDVKVVIKNFPLSSHKQAMKAALYALAAGKQGNYYEMYKKILDNYGKLRNNEDLPIQYAIELGLDVDLLKRDMADPAFEELIKEEISQLRNTGMRLAVPKFLINGKEPKGRTVDAWSASIDEILVKK